MKRRFSWLGIAMAAGVALVCLPARSDMPNAAVTDESQAGAAAAMAASAGAASADSDSADAGLKAGLAPVPWKIGEYFQFAIDWNGLNGGGSLMQVQNIVRVDGR